MEYLVKAFAGERYYLWFAIAMSAPLPCRHPACFECSVPGLRSCVDCQACAVARLVLASSL
jgi:hypothetical protein